MKIAISLSMPEPGSPSCSKEMLPMPIEDRVKDALDIIDSGHSSPVEWNMINRLYKALCRAKPSKRVENLKNMIEPVLAKFGYHEVSAVEKGK